MFTGEKINFTEVLNVTRGSSSSLTIVVVTRPFHIACKGFYRGHCSGFWILENLELFGKSHQLSLYWPKIKHTKYKNTGWWGCFATSGKMSLESFQGTMKCQAHQSILELFDKSHQLIFTGPEIILDTKRKRNVHHTTKHGRGSVVFWGCYATSGTGYLEAMEGAVTFWLSVYSGLLAKSHQVIFTVIRSIKETNTGGEGRESVKGTMTF